LYFGNEFAYVRIRSARRTAHIARGIDKTNRRQRHQRSEGPMPHDNAKRRNSPDASSHPSQKPADDDRPEHRRFWYSASGSGATAPNTETPKPQQRPVDPNEVRR
jgi:hypothetical protein